MRFQLKSGYNTALGYPAPVDPSTLSQPIGHSKDYLVTSSPIDMNKAYLQAQQQAATL